MLTCALLLPGVRVSHAQQTATVTLPVGVSFNVTDVSASTSGAPDPSRISFTVPKTFPSNQSLVISVRADAASFAGPGTVHPASSQASWTATATTGTVSGGTLSATAYTQVFRKNNPNSGSIDLRWTLGPIAAAGLRAGTHTLAVRWKIEAF
jgi:hypothetical protein